MRINKIRFVKIIISFFSLAAFAAELLFPVISGPVFLFIAVGFGIYLWAAAARPADDYLLFKFSVFKTE